MPLDRRLPDAALSHARGGAIAAPCARAGGGSVAAAFALGAALALAGCERDAPTAPPPVAPRSDVGEVADSSDPSSFDPDYIAPLEVLGDEEGYYLSSTVIARFKPGANAAQVAAAHGATVRRAMLLPRAFVLDVPRGRELSVVRALSRNPNVEFAEPDRLMALAPCGVGSCVAPSDPWIGYRWDLNNDGNIVNTLGKVVGATGAVDADIDWLEAFDFLGADFAGAAKIGIIDSGIHGSIVPTQQHPDLAGRVIAAQNFATGYPPTLIQDRIGHGTHVAGIAAARGHNGIGVSGVAYGTNIRLINAKACERYGDGTQTLCPASSVASAIMWAVDQGANVLNLSFGTSPTATSGSAAQQIALQYARSKNVLPFCASGNDGYPGLSFPARFPECVAVGATTWSDTRAGYSNYGTGTYSSGSSLTGPSASVTSVDSLELIAPGGDDTDLNGYSQIYSTANVLDTYAYRSGTSMATPQAAGLAALLYATGITSPSAVLARMRSTADDLGPSGWDAEHGFGRINVYRAITLRGATRPPEAAAGGPYAGDEGSAIQFDGSQSSDPDGKPLAAYQWSFGDGASRTGAAPTYAFADNGTYTVTLAVTDESGQPGTATTTATVANVAPTGTFATSAPAGRVVVGTPVTLSFTGVTDPSAADVAAGITAAYSCAAGGAESFTASPVCATPSVGAVAVRGLLTDKDGGVTPYGPLAIAVDRASTFVTVHNVTGQYSDRVSLSASLKTDAGPSVATSPTGTMVFYVDGDSVGTQAVMGTGTVKHTITLTQPASPHTVTARFRSTDANYAGSELSDPATLTVNAEAARLTYAPSNVVALRANSLGTADGFSLVVTVAESDADPSVTPGDAAQPGDIARADVRMALAPVAGGGSIPGRCTASSAGAVGSYAERTYTCAFDAGTPVNTYVVQVGVGPTATGTYYAGSTEDVLTVYDPSLGFTTGGGSFAWPGSGERTTFGFTIKYNKSGSNTQGSLIVVRHTADGVNYRLKSNALEGLALGSTPSGARFATFSGKATYIEPGWATATGNVTFTAFVEDGDEAVAGAADRFWLQVSGGMSMAGPASGGAQPLTGGNVVVGHGGP